MSWLRFFRRARRDDDCARELESYLAIETDDNVARGMGPKEARAAAVRKLGNPTRVREQVYEMHTLNPIEHLWRDVRAAVRVLRRERAFAAAAILSLTLGIGANTAMFQLLEAVRLRPLPVADASELAEVRIAGRASRTGSFNGRRPQVTYGMWTALTERQQAFTQLFAWSARGFNTSPAGQMRFVEGLFVSGSYFHELRVPPFIGRLLGPADDTRGCGPTGAVVSHAYWQRELGGDPAVLSRTLSLDGVTFPIVGVTPSWFFGMEVGRMYDVAIPMCADALFYETARSRLDRRDAWWLAAAGRLAPGWSLAQASQHLEALSPQIFRSTLPRTYAAADAESYLGFRLNAFEASTGVSTLRTNFEEPLTILLVITGLVLLTACANLANLLLARATARGREIAVRLAIGATRRRVVMQLLVESAVIALAGAALGSLVAGLMSRMLVAVLAGDNPAVFVDLSWNVRMLAFTSAVAFVACLLFGVAPALRATAIAPILALRSGGRGLTAGRERFGLRRTLVVAQVAMSLVLLLGALLFSRTLYNLLTTDSGFAHSEIVVAGISHLSRQDGTSGERAQIVRRELRERLASLPDVAAVAQADVVPLGRSGFWNEMVIAPGSADRQWRRANFNRVSDGYFGVMGIPLVAGRDFDARDTLQSPPVAIVSQEFARQFLDGGPAIGRQVQVQTAPGEPPPLYDIVGVARDTLVTGLRDGVEPLVYVASTQEREPGNETQFVIRPRREHAAVITAVDAAVSGFGPALNTNVVILSVAIRDSLVRERLMAALSTAFGILAGLLAAIGLYGVMTYTVSSRTNEIGIRIAMGAARRDVLGMILREVAVLVALGLAVGGALAVASAGSARSLLFGLDPTDPTTVASACALLALIGLLAGLLPARRAAALDPCAALRND